MVNKEVYEDFIRNAATENNYKKGYLGIHLENAMRLFNTLFYVIGSESPNKICKEHNITYAEFAEHLITFDLLIYHYSNEDIKDKLIFPLLKWNGKHREDLFIEFCELIRPVIKKR